MKKFETTYGRSELKKGRCKSCKEISKEIVIGDGRCVTCIEEKKFFNETMKNISTQRSPFDFWS